MARYEVTAPDGARYEVTAPDDATEDQVLEYARQKIGPPSQPAAPMKKDAPGNVASFAEGAAQGITFGFSDEIEGALRAAFGKLTGDSRSMGDLYDENVAKPRARIDAASEENPLAFYGGEIGSAFLVPEGLASWSRAPGPSTPRRGAFLNAGVKQTAMRHFQRRPTPSRATRETSRS